MFKIKRMVSVMTAIVTTLSLSTSVFAAGTWGRNSKGEFVNPSGQVINGATMMGVDVSYHNGKIDWKKVKESGIDYAILRIGYGDDIASQDDKKWEENVKGCEENNIPYGVYIYSYAMSKEQANSEVNHVLRKIQGHIINFPIYYDLEENEQRVKDKVKVVAPIFLNAIHNKGYEVGVYASLNWWQNVIAPEIASNLTWFKWVARYNDSLTDPKYDGVYQMWQCCSDAKVPGISGNVDLNFWFGDVRDRTYDITKGVNVAKVSSVKVVKPKKATISSVKAGKKKLIVRTKKQKDASGYMIVYSKYKNFKNNKSVSTKKTSKTIKKLKSKKRYYVKVKAYKKYNGKKYYSKKWSKKKSAKIK